MTPTPDVAETALKVGEGIDKLCSIEMLHGNFVELLQPMVQSGLDFGQLYKEPRYPWLHI